jgi:hypothetical protein
MTRPLQNADLQAEVRRCPARSMCMTSGPFSDGPVEAGSPVTTGDFEFPGHLRTSSAPEVRGVCSCCRWRGEDCGRCRSGNGVDHGRREPQAWRSLIGCSTQARGLNVSRSGRAFSISARARTSIAQGRAIPASKSARVNLSFAAAKALSSRDPSGHGRPALLRAHRGDSHDTHVPFLARSRASLPRPAVPATPVRKPIGLTLPLNRPHSAMIELSPTESWALRQRVGQSDRVARAGRAGPGWRSPQSLSLAVPWAGDSARARVPWLWQRGTRGPGGRGTAPS